MIISQESLEKIADAPYRTVRNIGIVFFRTTRNTSY